MNWAITRSLYLTQSPKVENPHQVGVRNRLWQTSTSDYNMSLPFPSAGESVDFGADPNGQEEGVERRLVVVTD